MSITSSRTVQIQFSGEVTTEIIQSAKDNLLALGEIDIVSLVQGDNVITAPVVSGLVITGLMIIPPAANTDLITLKGDVTDINPIPLHLTDPVSLSLDTTFVSLVLNAAAAMVVRLVWT